MERQKKWVPLYIQVLTGGIREKFDMLALKAVNLLNVARPYSNDTENEAKDNLAFI